MIAPGHRGLVSKSSLAPAPATNYCVYWSGYEYDNSNLLCQRLRRLSHFLGLRVENLPYLIISGAHPSTSPSSVQFSSVAQSCPTLCDPMNHSMPGLPVHRQLPEFTQTLAYRVGDAIQPSYPLSSPSPPAPNPSQHQGLFQWVNSSHEVAKVLEFQLQHQSFQWTPRTDL